MSDTPTRSPLLARPPRRHLRLAGAALLWERAWPALWPAVGVLGSFVALALFDLPALLPGPSACGAAGGLGRALRRRLGARRRAWCRLPDREAERRRIEQASGFSHRPLAALEDRLSGAGDDPAIAGAVAGASPAHDREQRRLRVGCAGGGAAAPRSLRASARRWRWLLLIGRDRRRAAIGRAHRARA